MRFKVLLLVVLFGRICTGQELSVRDASMSSSDKRIELSICGNSMSGRLALMDSAGNILLYDGHEVIPWNNIQLPNPDFVQSIFINDSMLYFTTADALLLYDQKLNRPILLQKATDQFFAANQSSLLYYADTEWFEVKGKQLKKTDTPDQSLANFANYIELPTGEAIRKQDNQLLWSDSSEKLIANLPAEDLSYLHVDRWHQPWIIRKGKLFQLDLIRASDNEENYYWEERAPEKFYQRQNMIIASYRNEDVVLWNEGQAQLIWSNIGSVTTLFLDDQNGCWIITDKTLHFTKGDLRFQWSYEEIKLQGKIVSVINDGMTISIITANNGILQTRQALAQEDWIWIPYRYNSKVKNLQLIDAVKKDKLYLFSESFGIFVLDKQEVSTITKNFPSIGIQSVVIEQDAAYFMDKGKRFHRFDFGRKSIQNYPKKTALPEPKNAFFHTLRSQVIYSTGDRLCLANPQTNEFQIFDHPIAMEKTMLIGNKLMSFGAKPQSYQLPSSILKSKGARIMESTLLTKNGKNFYLLPYDDKPITLSNADFPITITASSVYPSAPKQIEYSWKTLDGESIQGYQFASSFKLKSADPLEKPWKIETKVGEKITESRLRNINLIYVDTPADYRWAIYLSEILAALLLAIIIYNKWNSATQQRKIQTLRLEKKALELEQKALQLQLNPHFIFNALNGVKGMIALGDSKKARQYLSKISSLMRTMLNDARTDKIPINSEVNMLRSYLEIEQELRGFPWQFSIEVEQSLNSDLMIPPMMIQPFVENAIVHAFPHSTDDGMIKISFHRIGPKVQVTIEDNGIGLSDKSSAHESVALQLIQDRLKYLNAGTKRTDFSLKNKANHDSKQHGVLVEILLPILS